MSEARQGAAERFVAGALASVISRTACAPLDRIKMLNQTGSSTGGPLATLHAVVKAEGWQGLWRGNLVNCQRVIPSKGVLLCCSDIYRDALRPLQFEPFLLGAFAGTSCSHGRKQVVAFAVRGRPSCARCVARFPRPRPCFSYPSGRRSRRGNIGRMHVPNGCGSRAHLGHICE